MDARKIDEKSCECLENLKDWQIFKADIERGFKYGQGNKQQHNDLRLEFQLLWIHQRYHQPDNDQEISDLWAERHRRDEKVAHGDQKRVMLVLLGMTQLMRNNGHRGHRIPTCNAI